MIADINTLTCNPIETLSAGKHWGQLTGGFCCCAAHPAKCSVFVLRSEREISRDAFMEEGSVGGENIWSIY